MLENRLAANTVMLLGDNAILMMFQIWKAHTQSRNVTGLQVLESFTGVLPYMAIGPCNQDHLDHT